MNISGSEELLFTPVGKSTTVDMSAKWPHPSFTGDILPLNSKISKDSFSAKWKSVSQKRNFPQQWRDDAFTIRPIHEGSDATSAVAAANINSNAFGANLYVPVNGYQKTTRSVKYSFLCILLTFAAFFLIETSNKKSVHPFQYGLVGLALVLFYTLLLSFSEYIGFNFSYAVAAVATIGLIAWFVKGILSSSRLTIILSVVLLLVYTYVFTILQLQDYALLLGSVGLFITLAVIMHFSKKIQW
jgi:inner membrane protein